MYRMMYKDAAQYVSKRNDIYYYVRRVPLDVIQHYASSRISFSLRTKSLHAALRTAHSVSQRLEDYWLGLRLQQMDIPAIHLVQVGTSIDTSPSIMEAVELYLSINGKEGTAFKRTARRNAEYVAKTIGNKPIASFSSSEAAQFRDWCLEKGMTICIVKRVFRSVRAIINIVVQEHGIEGSNAFSGTFIPDDEVKKRRLPIPTNALLGI